MVDKRTGHAYESSHPWLTFQFDARQLNDRDWLLLGEVKSKCEHILGAPLLPETMDNLSQIYLVKGARATTAIEGNTLSEEEVARRIKGDMDLPPSKAYLGREIDNVVTAYNRIGRRTLDGTFSRLSVDGIQAYNRLVLKDLPLGEDIIPGETRRHAVGAAGYRAAPPEDCEFLLGKLVHWLNDDFFAPEGEELVFGVLKAILAHLYFVWIHPFGDGNGRTARLIEFQIILSIGAPAVVAHLLSNHYNQTRSEYYRQLDLASKSDGDVTGFIHYALQGFVDGLREEIRQIQDQQLIVHWISHVHRTFSGKGRREDERRRKLMLALSECGKEWVPLPEVRHLTPQIAELYAGLSEKTVGRDVDRLVKMGLVVKSPESVRCKWELLRDYLSPARAEGQPGRER